MYSVRAQRPDNILANYKTRFPAFESTLDLDFINDRGMVNGVQSFKHSMNLLTYTEDFSNAVWQKQLSTVTPNTATAPNGTLTADTLSFIANSGSQIFQSVANFFGTFTFSVWVRTLTGTKGFRIGRWNSSDAGDYTTFTATTTWIRYSVTKSITVPSGFYIINDSASAGDILIWGAQVELGSVATDYIPTTSASAAGNGSLKNVTFTRFTTGTYFGADGLLKTAAINEPRFEYDPVSRRPLGLLIEESRANLLLNSDVGATQSVTVTAVQHTLSFWGTGSVSLSGASTAGPLAGTGTNNRVSLVFTPTAGPLTLTVIGSVTRWQLEAGASATSYIPTTTASATRGADVVSMTGANFSSWYNASEGTVLTSTRGITAGAPALYSIDDTTSANRILAQYASPVNVSWRVVVAGSDQYSLTASNVLGTAGEQLLTAHAYAANNFAGAANGRTLVASTSGSVPTVSKLVIGANVAGLAPLNSHMQRLVYHPKRLPNHLLQGITA